MTKIGFMQGRLSPIVEGKIQAFPKQCWQREFELAARHGFTLMEWTLDQGDLYDNPLMSETGRKEIRELSERYSVTVSSISGDCLMQAPFFKASRAAASRLLGDLKAIIDAMLQSNIRYLVMPLVDNGRISSAGEIAALRSGLAPFIASLRHGNIKILFESDLEPGALAAFISGYEDDCFGINYDIGNSASLGHSFRAEIAAYGSRIDNVHVKDRLRGGTTVPLGEGAANLPETLRLIRDTGYRGNFILQTARATDGNHEAALCHYRDLVAGWLRNGS